MPNSAPWATVDTRSRDVGWLGGLGDGSSGALQGDGVQAAQVEGDPPPGQPGAASGDADQQQGRPAEQDVGADAGLDAVEHWPQLHRGLQVAEAAFGLQQVLVAQGDVLGAQVRVGGGAGTSRPAWPPR
jgi:hypothetical protein